MVEWYHSVYDRLEKSKERQRVQEDTISSAELWKD